ncbi:FtsX-like permease family protein [Actinoplanes sp. NPDC024001]|uniref:FtsX-like permease family protein n=1 Tax=Actinoplanes sp. NPDC024001 TaxID=3154598 RepID=UPI0033C03B30
MLALVLGAVRERTAQVLTILVLAALATAIAAAGPWFGFAASGRAAVSDLAGARPAERVVSVRQNVDTQGKPRAALDRFSGAVRAGLPIPVVEPAIGLTVPLTVRQGPDSIPMPVAYREHFCANVRLDGPCPARPDEVAISQEAGRRLGLAPGDPVELRSSSFNRPLVLRVVARYTLTDPAGAYWSSSQFRAEAGLDLAFAPLDTFAARQLWGTTAAWDAELSEELLRGDDGHDVAAALAAADARLGSNQLRLSTAVGPLLETIARDRETILAGVLTAGVQMLLLSWFAVGLAGWYTLRDRRADTALLKLRGVNRSGMLRLAWGQHLVPLLCGVALGAAAGYLLAHLLAGPIEVAADRRTALALSAAAVAAVLLGSMIVLAVVEAAVLGRPVSALLRRAVTGRGDWRSALADVLLLVVAAAVLYQARSGGPAEGLTPAASALAALALGLLVARLLSRAAARAGGVALRSGRLRFGLTALQISRSAGTDRVFMLIVVAVALFVTSFAGWRAEQTARADRSAAELGAVRVLSVDAPNRTVLLHAVRQADPAGREAMAAVLSRGLEQEVLEVDTGRLAAVASWRPEFGPVAALPGAMSGAAPPEPTTVTGGGLTARIRRDGPAPLVLSLLLQHEASGERISASFGTLAAGEQTVTVPLAGCDAAPGCRIMRWEVTTPPDASGRTAPPPAGSAVTVRDVRQTGPEAAVLDSAALGDMTRWRPGTAGAAVDVTAADGVLRLAGDANTTDLQRVGAEVWSADTPVPLPVVLAGTTPSDWQYEDPVLGSFGEPIPVRVTATVSALPAVGRRGLVVDLDATRRMAGEVDPNGEYQVWLAPGARAGLVADLTAAGLTVTGDETVTGRIARLGDQGPAAVVRFALLTGVAALLLAAAVLAVAAAVDRRAVSARLAALRVQGLPGRDAEATGYAGTAAVIITGLACGVLAAVLASALTGSAVPSFTDGWQVLAAPPALPPGAVLAATGVALLVLGGTGWLTLLPLLRSLRERTS